MLRVASHRHLDEIVGSVSHAPAPVVQAPARVHRSEARGISMGRTERVRAGGLTIAEADGRSFECSLRSLLFDSPTA